MKKLIICITLPFLLFSCSYLKHASIQAEYARIQNADPGQVNLKHMIDRETFIVIGKTIDDSAEYSDLSIAIAAYSSKFKQNERVDTMYFAGAGTHYGLNLPEGDYKLLVFADQDGDKIFNQWEVVGQKSIVLNETTAPEKVLARTDIKLTPFNHVDWVVPIQVPEVNEPKKSLFFPTGTIRSLDDQIFDEGIATLGMYDPASFLEMAPTMFYALEENTGYKMPVVFVHGIGGTSRAFKPFVERLDRNRYKPWFFYYPSGGDLDQLAEVFYRIFLSGTIIPMGDMPMIIVAHSMGGLVVREAINKYKTKKSENKVALLVTIASPLGGHAAAASGEKHGAIVLPAWRDVNPNNRFIKELYRKPLPEFVNHQLIYAYHNPDTVKFSENSDGVVPLSSQLHPVAQKQSHEQFGYNSSHTDILNNEEMIGHILDRMGKVKNIFPESHLILLSKGGYNVNLGEDYSPMAKYVISTLGKYLMALSTGELAPYFPYQEKFIRVVKGETPATAEFEKGWLKFLEEHPELQPANL